jgi:hypothetical protein
LHGCRVEQEIAPFVATTVKVDFPLTFHLYGFIGKGAGLDMLGTYSDKATLDRDGFLLPFFTAAGNLNHACLG